MKVEINKSDAGSTFEEHYDGDRLVKIIDRLSDGRISLVMDYFYDADGRTAAWTVVDAEGSLIRKFEVRRSAAGAELIETDGTGRVVSNTAWED